MERKTNDSEFKQLLEKMKEHHMPLPVNRIQIQIPDARNVLAAYFQYFLEMRGENFQWLPEYEHLADWLADNKGRGLCLSGDCGRGKSLFLQYILPAIMLKFTGKIIRVVNSIDLAKQDEDFYKKKIFCIDEVGAEEIDIDFGRRRDWFARIADDAEKNSKLLIFTTNFDGDALRNRYDERTLERIVATTQRVKFKGKSLRK